MKPVVIRWPAAWLLAMLFLLFGLAACASPSTPNPQAPAADIPERVLFVGNSFTYFNNSLHGHYRNLAAASDPTGNAARFTKAMTISGEELANHEGGLRQMLDVYEWDAVVLQGHSLEAVDEERRPGLEAAAEKYARLIRSEGAEPFVFMTWAYRDRPEMTAVLDSVYSALGARLGVTVAPVGLAFAEAIGTIPGVDLFDPDGFHPSRQGTYLAACVFYAVLRGASPVGNAYTAGIGKELAQELQQTAWRVVNDYKEKP
jgi:hypothetical protein